jgi:hypothetical protein
VKLVGGVTSSYTSRMSSSSSASVDYRVRINVQLTTNDKQVILLAAGFDAGHASTVAQRGPADFWAALAQRGKQMNESTWQGYPECLKIIRDESKPRALPVSKAASGLKRHYDNGSVIEYDASASVKQSGNDDVRSVQVHQTKRMRFVGTLADKKLPVFTVNVKSNVFHVKKGCGNAKTQVQLKTALLRKLAICGTCGARTVYVVTKGDKSGAYHWVKGCHGALSKTKAAAAIKQGRNPCASCNPVSSSISATRQSKRI